MENQPHTRFVLAVDPALSMGVAVGEVGQGLIDSGVMDAIALWIGRVCMAAGGVLLATFLVALIGEACWRYLRASTAASHLLYLYLRHGRHAVIEKVKQEPAQPEE